MQYTQEQKTTRSSTWDELNPQQQQDANALYSRMDAHLIAETEEFYRHHPELKLTWNFTVTVHIREQVTIS